MGCGQNPKSVIFPPVSTTRRLTVDLRQLRDRPQAEGLSESGRFVRYLAARTESLLLSPELTPEAQDLVFDSDSASTA